MRRVEHSQRLQGHQPRRDHRSGDLQPVGASNRAMVAMLGDARVQRAREIPLKTSEAARSDIVAFTRGKRKLSDTARANLVTMVEDGRTWVTLAMVDTRLARDALDAWVRERDGEDFSAFAQREQRVLVPLARHFALHHPGNLGNVFDEDPEGLSRYLTKVMLPTLSIVHGRLFELSDFLGPIRVQFIRDFEKQRNARAAELERIERRYQADQREIEARYGKRSDEYNEAMTRVNDVRNAVEIEDLRGYVYQDITRAARNRKPKLMPEDKDAAKHASVHVRFARLEDAAELPSLTRTFIHESTHKYLGTFDYAYFANGGYTVKKAEDEPRPMNFMEAADNADSYANFVYEVALGDRL